MSYLTRIGVALLLAAAAAVLNLVYTTHQPAPPQFVAIRDEMKQGESITEEHLMPLGIPGQAEKLRYTFVPYDKRAVLLQARTTRTYQPGDLVLQRDVEEQGSQIAAQPEILRFRVIAVGNRFKRANSADVEPAAGSGGSTVTVAVKIPDPNKNDKSHRDAERMLRVVKSRSGGGEVPPELRILGVVVFPRDVAPSDLAPKDAHIEQPGADEMALPVSLQGVESVPAVILSGGEIGFLMLPDYP
jgi:hypothetical protein